MKRDLFTEAIIRRAPQTQFTITKLNRSEEETIKRKINKLVRWGRNTAKALGKKTIK